MCRSVVCYQNLISNYDCKMFPSHLILPSYFVYPSSLPFYIVYLKFIVDIVSAQKQNYGWDVTRKLIMLCIKALLITFTWAFESNSVYSIHFYYSQTLLAHILLMYLFSDGTYFASHQYTSPSLGTKQWLTDWVLLLLSWKYITWNFCRVAFFSHGK